MHKQGWGNTVPMSIYHLTQEERSALLAFLRIL
jgi:hypothetical protein